MDRRPRDLFVLLPLWLMTFSSTSQVFIISPILPRIGETLHVPPALLGTLITSYGVAAGLFALMAGPISDRVGRRRILLVGTAWMALALWLHAFARSYAALLAVRGAAGAAGGILAGAAVAYVGDYYPYARRGWANGWIMSGFAVGQVLGIPLGTLLAKRFGYDAPFLGFAVVMTFACALAIPFLPQPRVEAAARLGVRDALAKYGALLRHGPTLAAAACYLLMFIGVSLYIGYLPTWLEARFHASADGVAAMFLAGGVAAVLTNPLAGRFSDRWGRKGIILGSCLAFAGLLLSTTAVVTHFWLAFPAFFLTMAAAAARIPPMQSLLTALVGSAQRGSLLSLTSACGQTGFALGGGLGGLLYARVGFASCTIGAAASVLAMALLVWRFVPEPSAAGGAAAAAPPEGSPATPPVAAPGSSSSST
ncbi:MAG TPA: MFS transporter [Myxococcota bacterium]|nr:MFS transporter [Myxococcota bacterium]